ncbi:hypothetical protein SK128_011503 [Halocaridina rubra]|uniref:C-type lectin domain-containing protein n=1 Tax=Halocaridina rubra TaxID=373956 RepID=A0AAN9AF78_HALRR
MSICYKCACRNRCTALPTCTGATMHEDTGQMRCVLSTAKLGFWSLEQNLTATTILKPKQLQCSGDDFQWVNGVGCVKFGLFEDTFDKRRTACHTLDSEVFVYEKPEQLTALVAHMYTNGYDTRLDYGHAWILTKGEPWYGRDTVNTTDCVVLTLQATIQPLACTNLRGMVCHRIIN